MKGYDVRPGVNDIIVDAYRQLDEYFAGVRKEFRLPLDLKGTSFQLRIWEAVGRIPYGEVWSYQMVAEEAGYPRAYRAAGNAIGENPVAIVIPCHRVVRSDGTLGGYGGREYLKKRLLTLEGSISKIKNMG
jgi:O-6-methylguanine DNA methyltransferase